MCGIAGIVGEALSIEDSKTISRMVASMGHRGPDGNGVTLRICFNFA
jgi:asparagine synthetase B (glutamine-hydrolysing)